MMSLTFLDVLGNFLVQKIEELNLEQEIFRTTPEFREHVLVFLELLESESLVWRYFDVNLSENTSNIRPHNNRLIVFKVVFSYC